MPGIVAASFTTVPALFFAARGGRDGVDVARRGRTRCGCCWLRAIGAALSLATWVASARLATLWATRLLATRASKAGVCRTCPPGVALGGAPIDCECARKALTRSSAANSTTGSVRRWRARRGRPDSPRPHAVALGHPWARGVATGDGRGLARGASRSLAFRRGARARQPRVAFRRALARRRRHSGRGRASHAVWRATPTTRAVFARSARSWRIDPRYVAQVVGAVAMPTIMGGVAVAAFGSRGPWLFALPVALGRHDRMGSPQRSRL